MLEAQQLALTSARPANAYLLVEADGTYSTLDQECRPTSERGIAMAIVVGPEVPPNVLESVLTSVFPRRKGGGGGRRRFDVLPRGDLTRACAEGMMRNWVDQRIADLGEPVLEDLPWCPSGITANVRRWRRPGPVDAHVAVDELVFDPTDPTDVCRLDLTCWVDPPADERVCLPDQTMVGLAGAIPPQRQILPDPPEHHDPNPWGHQIWRTTSPPAGTDPLLQMCIAPVR